MSQCTAKSQQTGKQCKRHAVDGKSVCTVHGGKTPGGIASPHFKTGRYSKYLPSRLLADYDTSLKDSELLDLTNEIAVLDARLNDLMRRVDSGEAGVLWSKAQTAFSDLETARLNQDAEAMRTALFELGGLLKKGHSDYAVWGEIQTLMEQRRKLVETERRRRVDMHTMMRDDEVMLLVSYLISSITTHVKDRGILAAIQHDITAVLGTRVPAGAQSLSAGVDAGD